jgi:glutathione S-transferase
MSIDLYYVSASAPCRSVLLAASAIGVQLNLKNVNMMQGEHLTPEFIKVCNLTRTHCLQ